MTRVTQEAKERIKKLHAKGLKIREISDRLDISYSTIGNWISAWNAGFKSVGEYRNYLAQQKGFESHADYFLYGIKKKGLNSYSEQKEYLALNNGFKSVQDQRSHKIRQQGFKSASEYRDHLAKNKGFESHTDYQRDRMEQRAKRTENKKFSRLIRLKLAELNRSQYWLAKQLGVSRQIVSMYARGTNMPLNERLEAMCSVLGLNLEAILQEN